MNARICPTCASSAPATASWCENCGDPLGAAPGARGDTPAVAATSPCIACQGPVPDSSEDRWCPHCGQRQPVGRDHYELSDGSVAAVSDRGLRHHRNEDAVAIASRPHGAIMVVCDGVSSTERPDEGSHAACSAMLATLSAQWDEHGVSTNPGALDGFEAWMQQGVRDANDAIARVIADGGEVGGEPPSCTLVAAAVRQVGDEVIVWVGWLGDSRAYWISGLDGVLLTADHSWAHMQERLGDLSADDIAADPRANSITRWVGPDSPMVEAEVHRFSFPGPGRVILCTDGLWRYADAVSDMAHRSAEAGDDALEVAQNLSDLALTSGGHDNISVAVFDTGTVTYLQSLRAEE